MEVSQNNNNSSNNFKIVKVIINPHYLRLILKIWRYNGNMLISNLYNQIAISRTTIIDKLLTSNKQQTAILLRIITITTTNNSLITIQ